MTLEWAQGFLAGHNIYATTPNSVIADNKTLITLLDAFCQKYPEERILSGLADITQSLGGAKSTIVPKAVAPAPALPQTPKPDPKAPRES